MKKSQGIDEDIQLCDNSITHENPDHELMNQTNEQNEVATPSLYENQGSSESTNTFEMQNDEIQYTATENLTFRKSFDINDEGDWLNQSSSFLFEESPRSVSPDFYKAHTYETLFPSSPKASNLPSSTKASNNATIEDNLEFKEFTSASIDTKSTDNLKETTNSNNESKLREYNDTDLTKATEEILRIKNEVFEEVYTTLVMKMNFENFQEAKIPGNPIKLDNLDISATIPSINDLKSIDIENHNQEVYDECLSKLDTSLKTAINKEFNIDSYLTNKSNIQVIKVALKTLPRDIHPKKFSKNTTSRKPRANDRSYEVAAYSTHNSFFKGNNFPITQLGSQIPALVKRQISTSVSSDSSLHSLEIEHQQSFDLENEEYNKRESAGTLENNTFWNAKRDLKGDNKNIVSRFVSSISLSAGKSK